jgi:hypothetical protein
MLRSTQMLRHFAVLNPPAMPLPLAADPGVEDDEAEQGEFAEQKSRLEAVKPLVHQRDEPGHRKGDGEEGADEVQNDSAPEMAGI